MALTRDAMKAMLLDHMTDHAPKLKARLWRAKDRDAFLDERIDAAQEVLRGNLELLDRPDPAGEAMVREMAIAELFNYPQEIDAW